VTALPYDLVVVGAGVGGYSCAMRAAAHGLRVAIVEKDKVGGVCLNCGCIPSKVLLNAASLLRSPEAAAETGVDMEAKLNFSRLMERKAKVVHWLTSGVEALLYQRKVDVYYGTARLAEDGMVAIDGSEGHQVIRGSVRVVATGSQERSLPGIELDGEVIIGSTDALSLEELPDSIAIIGAGAVGTEFASMFVDFGCQVTLIEALPHILPLEDEECAQIVAESLSARGVGIHSNSMVRQIVVRDGRAHVTYEENGRSREIVADKVLVAVGRRPSTEELGLERLGVRIERGYVAVDEDLRATVPDVYAIGDCIDTLALAHVAGAEGKYVADLVAGERPRRLRYEAMPRATFCRPELASVGASEEQAREQGLDVTVSRFALRSNGKAAVCGETEGMVKIVAERGTGLVRGIHIVGHAATELISEAALAMQLEATAREIGETVHAHPTMGEALMEAAEAVYDRAVHLATESRN